MYIKRNVNKVLLLIKSLYTADNAPPCAIHPPGHLVDVLHHPELRIPLRAAALQLANLPRVIVREELAARGAHATVPGK